MGISSGLILFSGEAVSEQAAVSIEEKLFAKHNCKGKGSCPGLDRMEGDKSSSEPDKNSAKRGKTLEEKLFAKHDCKGKHGCPGLTADRESTKNIPYYSPDKDDDSKDDDQKPHLMTEDELVAQLNENGIAMYKSLSPEGKALARLVASQSCYHANFCAGLNGCETEYNSCSGQSQCRGRGNCAMANKSLAVKLVYDKMTKKRAFAAQKQDQ